MATKSKKELAAALSTPPMGFTVELIVGDWSRDGHEKTESHYVKCTHDAQDIEKFYKKGVKALKCDPASEVQEYEASRLSQDTTQKLVSAGFDVTAIESYFGEEVEECLGLYPEAYVDVYMFVAQKGSKDKLRWEHSKPANSHINIGGYGLFY